MVTSTPRLHGCVTSSKAFREAVEPSGQPLRWVREGIGSLRNLAVHHL